jgi:hypothetical protein
VNPTYPEFRRKLDEVLRRRDPAALRAFLIAQGQWTQDTSTDPKRAMWMMIAASPALRELHEEAGRWLIDHGYAEEAHALGLKGARQPPGQHAPPASRPARGSDFRPRHGSSDQRRQGEPRSPREKGRQ